MLTNEKKSQLENLLQGLSKQEMAWIGGFLSGLIANDKNPELKSDEPPKVVDDLTILFITETGNSKFLANEILKKIKAFGAIAKTKSIEQYRLNDLVKEKNLIIITSTHGEGEIPQAGKAFYDYISKNQLDLSNLNYLILALGDRNYPLFCKAGKDIDERFTVLQGKRKKAPIELDLDFENHINEVFEVILEEFTTRKSIHQKPVQKNSEKNSLKSFKNEFIGKIVNNINLNDNGSSKETHHIEIVSNDELNYEPGDSVGILFTNEELQVTEKLTPRLYSIASSPGEHGNEIHLTVALLRYFDENSNPKEGLFSGHLSRLKIGDEIKFYISKNRKFKLPADDSNIIMVGAGTGVAPFRSFLAQRNYRGANGKNWLFFGERNFKSDFLYQIEWQQHLDSGLLSKIDVAFSRDQKEKIYVQHRMLENAFELYQWLEQGAYFYVCGDKKNMAKDVENALLKIIASQGSKTPEQALQYLQDLEQNERYLKDVY